MKYFNYKIRIFLKIAHKAVVAFSVTALVLSPLGNLASLHLPSNLAGVFPKVNNAHAAEVIIITSGTTWEVPLDWNDADNMIEVIGGGGGGATGSNGNSSDGAQGARGGGGGAYAKSESVDLTPEDIIDIQVGSGGGTATNGTDTWFLSDSFLNADGGLTGTGTTGGSGGLAINSVGTTITRDGGNGGNAGPAPGGGDNGSGGGGGGGAAGPDAVGANGLNGESTNGGNGGAGGAPNGGSSGTGGGSQTDGNSGGSGTVWTTAGTGGGGGGGGGGPRDGNGGGDGGTSGLYGAGGAGGGGSGRDGGLGGTGSAGRNGIIVVTYTPSEVNISISGTCKQNNQSTDCSDTGSNSVMVAVDGVLQAQTDTAVDGSWSITGVTTPSADQIITVFIEGEAASSSQAVAVTKYSGSGNITGVELIEAHLSIGSNQRNTITNANLSQYDSSVSGKRTFHDVNSSVLTVDVDAVVSGEELYVKGGNTYQPNSSGGDTINTHDIEINGTFDLDSNVIAASGSWDNNGLFIPNTGSVSFTGIGSETISSVASAGLPGRFYHLEIDSPSNGATLTVNDYDIIASGQMTIETGDTLSISSGRKLTHFYTGKQIVFNGTISGAGKFVYRSNVIFPTTGTITSALAIDAQIADSELSARTYGGNVEVTNSSTTAARTVFLSSGTTDISGSLTVVASSSQGITLNATNGIDNVNVSGDLTAGALTTVDAGDAIWTISGNVNLTGSSLITGNGVSTFVLDGASKTLTPSTDPFDNLTLPGSITLANTSFTINGDLNMAGGVVTAGTSSITIGGLGDTVIIGGGNTLNNLTIGISTVTLQTSNLTVSGILNVTAGDKFKIEPARTLTFSGTGTPLVVLGTFEADDSSTVQYTGATARVASVSYGNLTLGGTGTYTLPANGTTTIKGDMVIASGANVASGSATLFFRKGGAQSITDNNGISRNLGEIAVRASTSGNTLLTLGSGIKVSSLSVDASQTLDVGGTYTLNIQGSNNVFNINGTFVPSTGTVQYTGGSANVGVPSSVYNHLTLGGTGTYTLPATDLTLRGNLTVTSGATVTKSSSNDLIFAIGGGSSQTVTDNNSTKQDLGEIQISANGGDTTLTAGSGIKVSSISVDAAQTLDGSSHTMEITGTSDPFTINGTFRPGTGTVQYTGSSANITTTKYKNLTLGGTGTYILPSSGAITLLGNLAVTSGADVASGSSTLFFRAGGTQSVTDSNSVKQNLGEIAVQASTSGDTTLTLGNSVRVASVSVDPSQTLDANGSNSLTLTNAGTPFNISGTFNESTGTVIFVGNGATTIPIRNYYNLKAQPSANSITHTFGSGTASISGTFTVGNGTNTGVIVTADTNGTGLDVASISISANSTLIADNSGELTVAKNFTNNGSFTHSSATIVFEGSQTSSIIGETTFNNFTSTTPGKKIKFGEDEIFTFAGTFTITGLTGNLIKIESTASGSQWDANFNNPQSAVTYARITDSGCDNDSETVNLDDNTSENGGGNDNNCWDFPDRSSPHGGSGSGSDGGGSGGGSGQSGGSGHGGSGSGSDDGDSGGGDGDDGGASHGGSGGPSPVIFIWLY